MNLRRTASGLVLALACVACGGNPRVASAPRLTALGPIFAAVPDLPDTGSVVAVYFTLADAEDSSTDVLFEVKRGAGAFAPLGSSSTGDVAVGGDGLLGLTAPPKGRVHRILWKPPASLTPTESVQLRLTPIEPEIKPPPQALGALRGEPMLSAEFTLATLEAEPR